MERLTAKHPKGGYYVLCSVCPRHNKECNGLDDCVYVLTKRLAAYENTGLTPEEINKLDTQRKAMAALVDSYKAEIHRWIPAARELPSEEAVHEHYTRYKENPKYIVMIFGGIFPTILSFDGNYFYDEETKEPYGVTHWMELPAPPMKEEV